MSTEETRLPEAQAVNLKFEGAKSLIADDERMQRLDGVLWRVAGNWMRETSGPGSRFEGETMEHAQARGVVMHLLPTLTAADVPHIVQALFESLIDQAHANRRLAWDDLDDDEIARHWSGVAGWLRRMAKDAAGEPSIDAATWSPAPVSS